MHRKTERMRKGTSKMLWLKNKQRNVLSPALQLKLVRPHTDAVSPKVC